MVRSSFRSWEIFGLDPWSAWSAFLLFGPQKSLKLRYLVVSVPDLTLPNYGVYSVLLIFLLLYLLLLFSSFSSFSFPSSLIHLIFSSHHSLILGLSSTLRLMVVILDPGSTWIFTLIFNPWALSHAYHSSSSNKYGRGMDA